MEKQKLKIGLLIDTDNITLWEYSMLQEIVGSNYAEIVLLVKKRTKQRQKPSLISRFKRYWKIWFYELYMKLEQKKISLRPNAFEKRNITELIDSPVISVETKETTFSDRIHEEDLKKIAKYDLDVFIRLGFRILRGGILNSAKHGVWSYHHGDNNLNRGGPAGVWEVIEGWDETGVMLQILTEDLDGGIKLYESYSSTDKSSILRNRNNYYWKAKSFIPRKLEELFNEGTSTFFKKVSELNDQPGLYYNRLFKTPSNSTIVKYVFLRAVKSFKDRIREVFMLDQWILLYRFEKEEKISKSFFRFKRLIPPTDRFWADPFIIIKENRYFIFFEEYIYKKAKGIISVIELNNQGIVGESEMVLETDYHLSYPFLFEENDKIYMIPESSQNKTIEIYECQEFPLKWKLLKVLVNNINAVDTTVFIKDKKYWIFTNVKTNHGASTWDELFLFFSDSLLGDWQLHPMNPIVSDVKKARPAGNVFCYNGNIFRPAQNCSKHYGYGISLRKITKLSETEYQEVDVQSIYPTWEKDLISTHTINSKGRLTIIDAVMKRRKFF